MTRMTAEQRRRSSTEGRERTCVTCVLTQGGQHTSCGIAVAIPTEKVACYWWVVLWPMHFERKEMSYSTLRLFYGGGEETPPLRKKQNHKHQKGKPQPASSSCVHRVCTIAPRRRFGSGAVFPAPSHPTLERHLDGFGGTRPPLQKKKTPFSDLQNEVVRARLADQLPTLRHCSCRVYRQQRRLGQPAEGKFQSTGSKHAHKKNLAACSGVVVGPSLGED